MKHTRWHTRVNHQATHTPIGSIMRFWKKYKLVSDEKAYPYVQPVQQFTPLIDPNVEGAISKHKEMSDILTETDIPLQEQLARQAVAMREYMKFVKHSERDCFKPNAMSKSARAVAVLTTSGKTTDRDLSHAIDESVGEDEMSAEAK